MKLYCFHRTLLAIKSDIHILKGRVVDQGIYQEVASIVLSDQNKRPHFFTHGLKLFLTSYAF